MKCTLETPDDILMFDTVSELREYLADKKWVARLVEGYSDTEFFNLYLGAGAYHDENVWPIPIVVGGLRDRHDIPRYPDTHDGLYLNPNPYERNTRQLVTWDEVKRYWKKRRIIVDGYY